MFSKTNLTAVMTILDKIVSHKRLEVEARKSARPVSALERETLFNRNTLSLKKFVLDENRTGIIAEYKRRSPSKGIINDSATVEEVTSSYALHASGISILTDMEFFGGDL